MLENNVAVRCLCTSNIKCCGLMGALELAILEAENNEINMCKNVKLYHQLWLRNQVLGIFFFFLISTKRPYRSQTALKQKGLCSFTRYVCIIQKLFALRNIVSGYIVHCFFVVFCLLNRKSTSSYSVFFYREEVLLLHLATEDKMLSSKNS